jgi:DNA-binding CsgD family transcriptional regulator
MALTSRDETDLLLPLMSGSAEPRPFATFLERLRQRTRVTLVSIAIRPRDGGARIDLLVGPNLRQRAQELKLAEPNLIERIPYDRLRLGRVYSGDEFDDHDPVLKARRRRAMRALGLADERVVRLLDEDAASAWLIIASERPCTAADSALLSSLAPYAAAALRGFVAGERRKLADALANEGLRRAGVGWIMFDKTARVLSMAPATQALLGDAIGHVPVIGQRIREFGPAVERALIDAAMLFAQTPGTRERTLVLSAEHGIAAILSPALPETGGLLDVPAMVAYCRQPRSPAPARAEHLALLHDLPRREAELAILLADGHSIAQAGQAMGLTIETTRNYSKRLFAKVGVRGQAELVRAVYESCAVLA